MTDIPEVQINTGLADGSSFSTVYPYSGTSASLTGATVHMGKSSTTYYIPGFVFYGVEIPANATITSANLSFYVYNLRLTNPLDMLIFGHKTGNSTTFGTSNNSETGLPMYRTQTTEKVQWTPGNWTGNAWTTTVDFSTVVQEIIDYGFPTNEAEKCMCFCLEPTVKEFADNSYRTIYTYEQTGNTFGAKFNGTYTTSSGSYAFSIVQGCNQNHSIIGSPIIRRIS